jgi:thiol-disulfide isomerase/thioredoxin
MYIKTAILVLLLVCSVFAQEQPGVGKKAIDFTLQTFDGATLSLQQLRGRVILLDFWATWCPPCREELPLLDVLQETYGRQAFAVVAVNIDNHKDNALRFLQANRVKLQPVWDQHKKVVAVYNIEQMPTTFIIDKNGIIRYVHAGFELSQYNAYKQQIQELLNEPAAQVSRSSQKPDGQN